MLRLLSIGVPFTDGGDLVFIMDDHDNFPIWIMIMNSMFPNWRMI